MPYTAPVLPTSEPDIRPHATPVRTVTCANAAALVTALADAQFGDDIILTAGVTYTGNFTLKVPTGTVTNGSFENYVTIRSSALSSLPAAGTRVSSSDSANMPQLIGSSSSRVFQTADGAHHYRLIGLDVTSRATTGDGDMSVLGTLTYGTEATYPSYISLERCYFHPNYDYGVNKSLQIGGDHIQIRDCYFTDCMLQGTGDCNGIWIQSGHGPYLIQNNLVQGMGENIFIQAVAFTNPEVTAGKEWKVPADITVRGNYIRRSLTYKFDHASYVVPCPTAGTGTIAMSGTTTVTFSTSQTGLDGQYIKASTAGTVLRILSGSGTSWTADQSATFAAQAWTKDVSTLGTGTATMSGGSTITFSSSQTNINQYVMKTVTSGTVVRITGNSGTSVAADRSATFGAQAFRLYGSYLSAKNMFETKGCHRVLVEKNIFENGWIDGQAYSIQFSAREGGWIGDLTFRWNKLINTAGLAVSAGDSSYNDTFFPSARPTAGFQVTQCLWDDPFTSEVRTMLAGNQLFNISGGPGFAAIGTITTTCNLSVDNVALGAGRTFTSTAAIFGKPWSIGCEIRYSTGRATITAIAADQLSCTATITTAFPVGALTPNSQANWLVAHSSIIGTSQITDSFDISHITAGGPNQAADMALYVGDNATPTVNASAKGTNHRWRYNIINSATGLLNVGSASPGTTAIDTVIDSATRAVTKNVFFGSGSSSYAAFYTGADDGGAGSTHNTAFHDPDNTGSASGGNIGFTNFAGRDYTLSGSSPYRAAVNWTGDNLPAGCDIATLNTYIANVVSGVATTNPFRYAPLRWS